MAGAVIVTRSRSMRTYPIKDREGRLFAFEMDNLLLGRRGLARVVGSLSGVRIRRRPKFLSWFREEEFCEFEVDGGSFVAWEPYGDSSRYWIGPKDRRPHPAIERVEEAFARRGPLHILVGA